MLNQEVKNKIINHYNFVSPHYQKLWGNHIHHGYYITGKESQQEATENLIKLLVTKIDLKENSKVLDIGCGVGGTSIWLAKNYKCDVTGITISPIQVRMAQEAIGKSDSLLIKPNFLVFDANNLNLDGRYDLLWAVETVSHLEKRKEFFKNCSRLLKKGGKLCIADWFKDEGLTEEEEKRYIYPINEKMMVSLWSSKEYILELQKHGLKLRYHEDISQEVKKT